MPTAEQVDIHFDDGKDSDFSFENQEKQEKLIEESSLTSRMQLMGL